jgi:hypothetical protein
LYEVRRTWKGKLDAQWNEMVVTSARPAKMLAVPSPCGARGLRYRPFSLCTSSRGVSD